jgi:hypothetical protein
LGGIFNLHPDSTVGIDPMCHGDLPTDAEVTVVFAPEHGTLTGSYPHWRYTPDADVGDRASDTAAVGYETAEGRLWTFVMRFEIDRGLWPYSGITRAPRASTYATDATFEFAGGVSYRCKLDDAPFAACGQVKTYSGLTPGVRRLSVVAYDEARDISATPAIYEWTVKRTPADATVTEGDVGTDGGIVTGGGVSVEVPAGTAGGPVAIVRQPVTFAAPSGYTNIGRELQIEAPAATAANPLRLTFDIDASTLTAAGVDEQTVAIVRDGVVVAPCTAADGSATPDPCVSGRARTATGASIVVLSPHASRWNAAKPGEPTPSAPPATSPGPAPSASPSPTVAPSPTPTFTPPVVTTPPDTSAPIVGLSASRQRVTAVLKRGLRVQLTSTEPCTALVVVTFRGKAVGSAPAALATGGSVAVRVTAARRALRAAKRPRLGVILSATDPAGNVATRTAAVRLRRG